MVVYLDVLFGANVLMDYITLLAAARLGGARVKRLRLLRAMVERWQAALRRRYGSADYARLNENMRRTFSKVISQDLYPFLKDIQAPTLLVWGSEDTETPLWMGEQMEKAIPDAGLVVFEGRTHFAFIEEWQRFLTIVRQFFWGGQTA